MSQEQSPLRSVINENSSPSFKKSMNALQRIFANCRWGRTTRRSPEMQALRFENLEARQLLAADFGDAPTPYPVTLAEDGARHEAVGPILGLLRDAENDGSHSSDASSDGADEDGVLFGLMRPGQLDATVVVNVSGAPGGALLDAWVDFNGDGNWGGINERVFSAQSVTNGANILKFDVPSSTPSTEIFARFRISSAGVDGPGGTASDGEVEDYAIIVQSPVKSTLQFSAPQLLVDSNGITRTLDFDGDGDVDFFGGKWLREQTSPGVYTVHDLPANHLIDAVDIDNDGDIDFLGVADDGKDLLIVENQGDFNFQASNLNVPLTDFDYGGDNGAGRIADIDGDGDFDLAINTNIGGSTSGQLWLVEQVENGWVPHLISTMTNNSGADRLYDSEIADLDRDGDMDITFSTYDGPGIGRVGWLRNDGDWQFTEFSWNNSFGQAVQATPVDFDEDGDMDVLATGPSDLSEEIELFRNNADGTFTQIIPQSQITPHTFGVNGVFATDLTGDGNFDIAWGDYWGRTIGWIPHSMTGPYTVNKLHTFGSTGNDVWSDDMNDDGALDLIVANASSNYLISNEGYVTLDRIDDVDLGTTNGISVPISGISSNRAGGSELRVTVSSSQPDWVTGSVNYSSPNSDGSVQLTRHSNAGGAVIITVIVEDAGADGNINTGGDNVSFSRDFAVQMEQVSNLPPTLDPIDDSSIEEDASKQMVALTGISAGVGESQPLRLTASSSNTDLIQDPIVDYSSPDSTGELRFTPAADQFGSSVITVTVEDGGDDNDLNTSGDNLTLIRTFTVTVSSVNDAPLIDPIINGESNGSDFLIDETFGTSGVFSQTLPSTVQWSEVIALDDGSLILGGRYGGLYSSGERFIVGKLTPEGQFDSSFGTQGGYSFAQFSARGNTRDMIVDSQGRILLSGYVRIGEYGAGVARFLPNGMLDASFGNNGLLTWSDGQTFGIKINERPDGGYVVGGRNTSTPVRNAPFHWISEAGVIEETTRYTGIGDLVMEMTFTPEGDLLAVVRDNNADFYTVRINSNRELVSAQFAGFDALVGSVFWKEDGSFFVSGILEWNEGQNPNAQGFVAKMKSDWTLDETFGDQGVVEFDGYPNRQPINMIEQANGDLIVSVSSNNNSDGVPVVISSDGQQITGFPADYQFQGGQGIAIDAEGRVTVPFASASSTADKEFNVVRWAPNVVPQVMTIDEDSGEHRVNLSGILAGGGESQNLRVTAISGNVGLIANPTVDYTSPDSVGALRFAPLVDQFGSAVITVTVEDGGDDNDLNTSGDNLTFSRTFTVIVNPVNDLPTLDPIVDLTVDRNSGQQLVNLTGIFAGGGESQDLSVTAISNNTALIPNPTIVYTSAQSVGELYFTPATQQLGAAVISVTVEDGGDDNDLATKNDNLTFTQSFKVTVVSGCGFLEGPIVNPSTGGIYYLLGEDTWTNAEANAQCLGGHLVTISDQQEQDWVWQTFGAGKTRHLWTGLTDVESEGDFIWSNNEPLAYTNWSPNEPNNNFNSGEHWVHLDSYRNGTWNDVHEDFPERVVRPIHGVVEVYSGNNRPPTLDPLSDIIIDEDSGLHFVDLTGISDGEFGSGNGANLIVNGDFEGVSAGGFAAPVTFAAGNTTQANAIGDFNGDGNLDAVVVNQYSGSAHVSLGNGDGTLGAPFTVSVGYQPYHVVTGDFNNDGFDDFVVSNFESNRATVSLGSSSGSFINSGNYPTGNGTAALGGTGVWYLEVADLNNDGNLDLITSNIRHDFVSTMLGDGNGGFGAPQKVDVGPAGNPPPHQRGPYDMVAGDFNNDGNQDIAVVVKGYEEGTQALRILSGDGTGRLVVTASYTDSSETGLGLREIASGDFNNDGEIDLALTNQGDSTIHLLSGVGDGTFVAQGPLLIGFSGAGAIESGDLDNDGNIDLVVSGQDQATSAASWQRLMGNGDGTFSLESAIDANDNRTIYHMGLGDFNADGFLDITSALKTQGGTGAHVLVVSQAINSGNNYGFTSEYEYITEPLIGPYKYAIVTDTRPFTPIQGFQGDHTSGDGYMMMVDSAYGEPTPLVWSQTVEVEPNTNYQFSGWLASWTSAGDLNQANIEIRFNGVAVSQHLASKQIGLWEQFTTGWSSGSNTSVEISIYEVGPANEFPGGGYDFALDDLSLIAEGGQSQALRVTATSSDISLIPHPNVSYTSPNAFGQLQFAPVADQFGSAVITVTVEDGGDDNDLDTPGDNLTFSRFFTVTVNPINDPPTLDPLSDLTVERNSGQQLVNLSGIFAGGGETQHLDVYAFSSNTGLIPAPAVIYTSDQSVGELYFTPAIDQLGTAVISVTVEDGGDDNDLATKNDNLTFTQTFTVTVVNSVGNLPPTLDPVSNITVDEDSGVTNVLLTGITAGEGESQPLRVTAVSDDRGLIPDPNVSYTSPNTFGQLSFVPLPDQFGYAVITVTVEDGGEDGNLNTPEDNLTFSRFFTVTVNPINDPPTLDPLEDITVLRNTGQQLVNLSGIYAGGGESQNLNVYAVSDNTALIPQPAVIYTSAQSAGELYFTPTTDQLGTAVISVTVEDGGDDNDLATKYDNLTFTQSFKVTVIGECGFLERVVNPSTGRIYFLLGEDNWDNADANAKCLGGHLVAISDQQEQNFVWQTFGAGKGRHLWTGLTDVQSEGDFVWSNGEPLMYTNWTPGEPDNDFGGEHWVYMDGFEGGTWDDHHQDFPNRTGLPIHGVVEVCAPNVILNNGQLLIDGTADDDHVVVSMGGEDTLRVEFGGVSPCLYDFVGVSSIRFEGNEGDDLFRNETLIDSEVYGHEGADDLSGGLGADTIMAGPGDDKVSGGGGKDAVFGEDGDDVFELIADVNYQELLVDFGAGNNTFVNNYGSVDFPTRLFALDGFEHQYDPATGTLVVNQVDTLLLPITLDNNGPDGAFRIIADSVAVLGPATDLIINMQDLSGADLNVALDRPLAGSLIVDLGEQSRDFNLTGISNFIGGNLIVTGGVFDHSLSLAVNHELNVAGVALLDLGFGSDEVKVGEHAVTFGGSVTMDGVNSFINGQNFSTVGDFTFDVSDEFQTSIFLDAGNLSVGGNLIVTGGASSDRVILNSSTQVEGNLEVRLNEGENEATLIGNLGGANVKYVGGTGRDDVTFGTNGTPAVVNIKTRSGDDSFHLNADASIATNSLRVDFGDGDDSFSSDYGQFDFNARLLNLDGYNVIYDAASGNLDVTQVSDLGDVVIDNNGPNSAIRFGNGQFNTLTPATDLRLILVSDTSTNVIADFDNPRIGNTVIQLRSGDRTVDFTGDSNTYTGLLRVEASEGVQTVNVAVTTDLNVDGTFIFNGRNGSDELKATHAVNISNAMLLRRINTFVNNAGVNVGGDFNLITFQENEDTRLISNTSFVVGGNLSYLGGGGNDVINFKSTGATITGYTYIDLAESSHVTQKQSVSFTGGYSTEKLVVEGGVATAGNYFTTDVNTTVFDDVIVNFAASNVSNTANFFGDYFGTYGTYRGGSDSDFVTFGGVGTDMLFAALTADGDDLFAIDPATDLDFLYVDFGMGNDTLDNQLGDPLPFDHNFINL